MTHLLVMVLLFGVGLLVGYSICEALQNAFRRKP